MTIAVLKLPFLIQESILKEMNYSQLTSMSICSLRMRRLIEFLHLTVPKICYKSGDTYFWCGIASDDGIKKALFVRQNPDLPETDTQEINLSSFKTSVRFSMHDNDEVTDTYIQAPTRIDMKVLEDYFTEHPSHHSANIGAVIDGDIPDDSNIWDIERLAIKNQPAAAFLRRFNGKNLHLSNVQLATSDLIHFLEEWGSNRAYKNLKTLYIQTDWDHDLNRHEVMDRFELQTYDPTNPRRPTHLHYNPEIIEEESCYLPIMNYGYWEMRRSDGKRAFLRCLPGLANFIVHDNLE